MVEWAARALTPQNVTRGDVLTLGGMLLFGLVATVLSAVAVVRGRRSPVGVHATRLAGVLLFVLIVAGLFAAALHWYLTKPGG